jgi:hypothetical protein
MTLAELLNYSADAAAQRYGMLIDSFRFGFARALDDRNFGSPQLLNVVTQQAYETASAFIDGEKIQIDSEALQFSDLAQNSTLEKISAATSDVLSEALSEHLNATADYLAREISIQIERDIAFLRQSLLRTQLNVSLIARAHSVPQEAALMRYRAGNASELHFFFHDRSGRAWPSRRFIRQTWRQNMLATYNETVLMTLAEHGIDRAIVRYPDPEHSHNGTVVSLHPGAETLNYAEIRGQFFHPNSQAFLEAA